MIDTVKFYFYMTQTVRHRLNELRTPRRTTVRLYGNTFYLQHPFPVALVTFQTVLSSYYCFVFIFARRIRCFAGCLKMLVSAEKCPGPASIRPLLAACVSLDICTVRALPLLSFRKLI